MKRYCPLRSNLSFCFLLIDSILIVEKIRLFLFSRRFSSDQQFKNILLTAIVEDLFYRKTNSYRRKNRFISWDMTSLLCKNLGITEKKMVLIEKYEKWIRLHYIVQLADKSYQSIKKLYTILQDIVTDKLNWISISIQHLQSSQEKIVEIRINYIYIKEQCPVSIYNPSM